MNWNELADQPCSVARTLSVIGDRWTLLILRECFLKVRRFDDFQKRIGIGRPILTDRLNKLVDAFVLTKVAYQTNPTRYEYRLTPKGLDLYQVLISIVHWGDVHMVDKKGRPVLHRHTDCGHVFDPVMVCSECGEPLNARHVHVERGPGAKGAGRLPMEAEEPGPRSVPKMPAARRRKVRASA
ncbi:helix-turn-helix domain-containing protein [Bradyrhizobium sp. CCBAU 53338]|uniref:winged helix-turn-helix transcriptional regulator n=1 Tax=Bradyrhizobium sp. CCBAU 53338 TaxID=1325111 RepID=UPI00188A4D1C|nr:helix-turn-helix domain-containing protein [Bradyrhizobium sp. CCBAU 53338]QOZ51593.1 transcriptional regulator [Bradyrhizobium sp. CCBAU 53338]